MSGGVLVVVETDDEGPRQGTAELIGAGRALGTEGGGSLTVALLGAGAAAHAGAVDLAGVGEIVVVPWPCEHFDPQVAEAALEALVEARGPAVVLAGHTIASFGFMPAVAARGGHGFATDVTGLAWGEGGPVARRDAFGARVVAELDFPGKETVLLTLRERAFAPAEPGGSAARSELDLDLSGAVRTERVELGEVPVGDVDITTAELLLSVGRGAGDGARIAELEGLADKMGGMLSCSRPPVDAGWVSVGRQVGQSGKAVAPKVYLALGISGAAQHVAGISGATTIIAVNSDPQAPIFAVAQYGAVADLYEIVAELGRRFGYSRID
jgi:electron transfer flavoprotein alpha subunit